MDVKEIVVFGLKSYKHRTEEDYREYYNKLNPGHGGFPHTGKINKNNKLKFLQRRIEDADNIIEKVEQLAFTTNLEGVEKYLSSYGTFCDRKVMYYDKSLEEKDMRTVIQIIMCEFFNSLQKYYMLKDNDEICKTSTNIYRGTTLIMMYHIGMLGGFRPSYAGTSMGHRVHVEEEFYKKYPRAKVILFEPNIEAARYLMEQAFFNDEEGIYGVVQETWNVNDVIGIRFSPRCWDISEGLGLTAQSIPRQGEQIYLTQDHKLLRGTKRIVKDHRAAVDTVKALTEVS